MFLVLVIHPVSSARAGFFDTYGADSRGMALGGALAAVSEGWASVHYNPAALALSHDIEVSLGLFSAMPQIEVDYVGGGKEDLIQFPRRLAPLDTITGPALGLLLPIQRCTPRRLPVPVALGVGLFVPRQALGTIRIVEETYPFDVMFNERNSSLVLNAALSTRITPAVYLGLGLATQLVGATEMQLSESGANASETKVRFGAPSLLVGVLVRPAERIRVGLVYRQKNQIRSRWDAFFQARITLTGIPGFENALSLYKETTLSREYVSGFTPENISLGGAYRFTERLKVSAELTWYRWSQYRGPLDTPLQYEFNDTLVPRMGIMYRITRTLEARAGFYFEPTPVANQATGFYPIGNHRYVPSLGLGYTFNAPWGLLAKPITADGYFQYHFLKSRDFNRAMPSNPFVRDQDLSSEGHVINLGLSMTFRF